MQSRNILFGVLILAACLTQFASDIYAPSLTAIAAGLNTSINSVQATMSLYMLGVALSQLIYGPLSEGFGRKPPMVAGLMIMGIGSLVCMYSTHITTLLIGRFIQGCGAGACASLWRAVFRDQFSGVELAKYTSYLVIFIMFIVPAAPVLGGYLQEWFNWQASFVFITLYTGIALLALLTTFQETHTQYHSSKLTRATILHSYSQLLKSRIFMGITASTFLSYGALFSWFVTGPILLIDQLSISPVMFGWLNFWGCGTAYALAGYLNGKAVKRLGMPTLMRFGWSCMILSGLLMIGIHMLFTMTVWTLMIPVILFYFGSTFIWPNAFATAFTPFGHIAGYAGALYGFMQLCGAAALSGVIAYFPHDTPIGFGIMMLSAPLCAWACYEWFCTQK